ncbi:MAG: glycosyltransferase [Patescibacteria group bacterium]
MNISIVIPNFNGQELLEKNLPSVIEASKITKNNISEIIVVDDGSTDTSVDFLTKNYKNQIKLNNCTIKIVKHTKNRGFSSSVNTGVRATNEEIICLLNTDVEPRNNFLEKATDLFKEEKVFAVSLSEDIYGPAKGYFENGFIQLGSKKRSNKTELSFYASGGSGLFRKSIWYELGGLDEKLLSPAYWEDIDICFRASKRGYTNLWSPDAHVVHNHESTVSKLPKKYIERIRERNQLLMLWKNIHSKTLISKHIKYLLLRAIKNLGYFYIIFMALSKIGLVIKARQKEIKECVVSDEAVFQKYS